MSYTIEQMPDEPVILIQFQNDFDPKTEMVELYEQRTALLNAQAGPVFLITDVRLAKPDIEGVMMIANAARAVAPANLREHLIVATSTAIKMAAKGLDSDTYHHTKLPVFGDLDEAMAYIHEQLDVR